MLQHAATRRNRVAKREWHSAPRMVRYIAIQMLRSFGQSLKAQIINDLLNWTVPQDSLSQ